MQFWTKLPWITLLLLLFTNGVFGWLISASEVSWWWWLMGGVLVFLIAVALTAPVNLVRGFVETWLKSDNRAFVTVIIGSFLAVIVLGSLHIFIRFLVLFCAGLLARLDLQTAGYGDLQAFGVIAIFTLTGFSLGLTMQQLL
ncbi:hypothetical protein [Lyngbya aestuarii]|uniref:hypothetical protein n=1 Tax=Lyngbya aestuarii TaxID=118322 RepID=UPI00403E239E